MNSFTSSNPSQPSAPTSWLWYSRWPVWAQAGPIVLILVSGSSIMGPHRWVQRLVGVLWMAWLVLEVNIDRANPRHQGWSRTRRVIVTLLGLSAIAFILISDSPVFR